MPILPHLHLLNTTTPKGVSLRVIVDHPMEVSHETEVSCSKQTQEIQENEQYFQGKTIIGIDYLYCNMSKANQRIQTGVRIEKRILKVLKALAEQLDMSLGDLLEGMALHCFEGKAPFSEKTLGKIELLKNVYELDLTAEDSHKLNE